VEPASATSTLDGVRMGSGGFSLRLTPGSHRIQVDELGYTTRTEIVRGERGGNLLVRLAIDEDHPRWQSKASGSMFGSFRLGGAFASGIGSGAERSCDRHDCDASTAFGGIGSLHVGYQLPSHTSFQIGVGVLSLRQNLDRAIDESYVPAPGSPAVPTEYQLKDELSASGPFFSLGAAQEFPLGNDWHFETAIEIGAIALGTSDSVSGSASGGGVTRDVHLVGSGETTRALDVFVAPEVFFSKRLGDVRFFVGLEVAFFLLEGPELETGDVVVDAGPCTPPSIDCAPGEGAVAKERSFGPFAPARCALRFLR
jgi:hypothetical protein